MLNLNLNNVFNYSLIGPACNYMFLQDLSLLINREKIILFVLLSCLRNLMVLEEKNICTILIWPSWYWHIAHIHTPKTYATSFWIYFIFLISSHNERHIFDNYHHWQQALYFTFSPIKPCRLQDLGIPLSQRYYNIFCHSACLNLSKLLSLASFLLLQL